MYICSRDPPLKSDPEYQNVTNGINLITVLLYSLFRLWALRGNGHIMMFMPISHKVLCLQAEADDDTGGNTVSYISNKSHDVGNSGVNAEREVNNFTSDSF